MARDEFTYMFYGLDVKVGSLDYLRSKAGKVQINII